MNQSIFKTLQIILVICIISFIMPGVAGADPVYLDTFSNQENWSWGAENDALITPTFGTIENGVELDYTFASGNWMCFQKTKEIPYDMACTTLSFKIKSEGATNHVSIKWTDADGSVFGTTISDVNYTDYQTINLTAEDYTYLWGGDSHLDTIVMFEITLEKSTGGTGKIHIKDLERTRLFDDFSITTNWQINTDGDATLDAIADGSTHEMALGYDLVTGNFVELEKIDGTIADVADISLSFDIKGEGPLNDLEFQWIDTDGSIFSTTIDTPDSTTYTHVWLSSNSFTYKEGGADETLDDLSSFKIVINRNQGGYGTVIIKNLSIENILKSPTLTPISIADDIELMRANRFGDYAVVNDIDCSSLSPFLPLATKDIPFCGSLEGNNHALSNLSPVRDTYGYNNDIGLFSFVRGATISNLKLLDVGSRARNFVGALAGKSEYATIINCYSSGSFSLTQYFLPQSSISYGGSHCGGLIGNAKNCVIIQCKSSVSLNGYGLYGGGFHTGGLIGSSSNNVIQNCSATGNVSSTGYYNGGGNVGGFIGSISNDIIESCYCTGDVLTDNYAGGFTSRAVDSTITNCYATGDVTVDGYMYTPGNTAGGFIGESTTSSIENSYAIGTTTLQNNSLIGMIGIDDSSTYTNCFWDYENSGADPLQDCIAGDLSGIESKTTAQMQTQSTFTNWDFDTIWTMDGYPKLKIITLLENFETPGLWNPDTTLGWWDIDGSQVYQHELVTDIVHSGTTAMKTDFDKGTLPWSLFGGFISVNNANYDFTNYTKLSFWLYGDVTILVKLRDRTYNEQDVATVTGTAGTWTKVSVDFSNLTINLADVDNVLFFTAPGEEYTIGTFYLDDIQLEN